MRSRTVSAPRPDNGVMATDAPRELQSDLLLRLRLHADRATPGMIAMWANGRRLVDEEGVTKVAGPRRRGADSIGGAT